jgi:outer membrane protein assembly factor BamB
MPGWAAGRLKWLVPGAAVIVAVMVVAALTLTSGGNGTSGSGSAGGAAAGTGTAKPVASWQALSTQHHALATWSYGKSLVVAANTQVTAYNQATGAVLWRTKAPVASGYNTMFCGGSTSASGAMAVLGIGVVTDSTGLDSDCHSVAALNLATGKLGWVAALPSMAEQKTYANSLEGQPGLAQHGLLVEVSGHTVVAGWMGVLAGFSLTSGARQWLNVIGGESNFENNEVKDIAISGASTYVVTEQVFPDSMSLLRIDTETGKIARPVKISKSMTGLASPLEATILSTTPLTVDFEQVTPSPANSIVGFTTSLAAGWVVHAEPPQHGDPQLFTAATLGDDQAHQFIPFALGGGLLTAVTVASNDGSGSAVVAFNAATGAKKWTATVPGIDLFDPIAVDGSAIQVAGISQAGQGNPVLVSIDAATGKVLSTGQPRVLGPAPLSDANAFYRYVTAGGHVYGVDWKQAKSAKGYVPAVFSLS